MKAKTCRRIVHIFRNINNVTVLLRKQRIRYAHNTRHARLTFGERKKNLPIVGCFSIRQIRASLSSFW